MISRVNSNVADKKINKTASKI